MDQTCSTYSTNGSPSRRRQLHSKERAHTAKMALAENRAALPFFGRTVKYRKPALVEHYRQNEITPVRTSAKQRRELR